MNKFALILPYFGRLPPYFWLWARSLAYVDMDVLFVTDIDMPPALPENLHVLKMSLAEVADLARRKLGSEVALTHARKLCDVKPFYGLLFEEHISAYAYWAFGDCDLVYGRRLNDELRRIADGDFDVASFKPNRISGGLAFVRNTSAMNRLVLELDDWREVLADDRNFLLDEIRNWLRFRELDSGRCTLEDIRRQDGDCFSALVWRTPGLRIYAEDVLFERRLYFYTRVRMSGSRLTLGRREIPAFHFVGVKGFPYFDMDSAAAIAGEEYVIDSAGFTAPDAVLSQMWRETRILFRWLPGALWQRLRKFV